MPAPSPTSELAEKRGERRWLNLRRDRGKYDRIVIRMAQVEDGWKSWRVENLSLIAPVLNVVEVEKQSSIAEPGSPNPTPD